jgi:hypothetical protein
MERLAGRNTDALVVINDEAYRQAIGYGLVAKGRVVRMPGVGVPVASYEAAAVDEDRVRLMASHLN